MKKSCGSLLLAFMVFALLAPDATAQQGSKERERQDAKKQDRQQKGQRRRGGRRGRPDDAPKIGDVAPIFKLKSLDGNSETDLADYKGKKPVVLLFGSYT